MRPREQAIALVLDAEAPGTRLRGESLSRTVPVEFSGRMFWAYDVSLSILLLEAIRAAMETPPEVRPSWADAVLEDLRIHVRVGADAAFPLDADEWDGPQREYVRSIIAEAGRRLRDVGVISPTAAASRYTVDGEPYFLRGHDSIDGVVAELSTAMEELIQNELPPVPSNDPHWFFGVEGGPRIL